MILFRTLILASLFFSLMLVSCESEIETSLRYGDLSPEYNVVNDWFSDNTRNTDPRLPLPKTSTLVEITEHKNGDDDDKDVYYEIEMKYSDNVIMYEVDFELSESRTILSVTAEITGGTDAGTHRY